MSQPQAIPTTLDATATNQPNPSRWRIQAKKLFLTYPQCDTTANQCLEEIKRKFGGNLQFAVVSQENHQDDIGLHLHCIVTLKEKYSSRDKHDLDSLVTPPKHGNYQTVRVESKVVAYVIKDGTYVSEGIDVAAYMQAAKNKKSTKSSLIAKRYFLH